MRLISGYQLKDLTSFLQATSRRLRMGIDSIFPLIPAEVLNTIPEQVIFPEGPTLGNFRLGRLLWSKYLHQ